MNRPAPARGDWVGPWFDSPRFATLRHRRPLERIGKSMDRTSRRDLLRLGSASLACPLLSLLQAGCKPQSSGALGEVGSAGVNTTETESGVSMKIQYLELVTPEVDATCGTYQQLYGLKFGDPELALGNARTAELPSGGLLGVRAPLRADEQPVVRPYFLVDDIEASVAEAEAAGAQIALPPMPLPGHGTCAIFVQGGNEHGLWQLEKTVS